LSDLEFPSWVLNSKEWVTCEFQGLGNKKQVYLDLLKKEMSKGGFQQVEEIRLARRPWASFISKMSNLKFNSPDGKMWIGIQAVPKDENLRVGFADVVLTKKQFYLLFAFSILFAFSLGAISAYVIGRNVNVNEHIEWAFSSIIVAALAFVTPPMLYGILPRRRWRRQAKQLLVETAESMGSKQTTPFKKTTYKLEG